MTTTPSSLADSQVPFVDWGHLRKYGDSSIECQCGTVYLSLCKAVSHAGTLVVVTEKACPSCHKTFGHVRAARSGPEDWTL